MSEKKLNNYSAEFKESSVKLAIESKNPIVQTHLDIAMQGFLEYGVEYTKEFIATTKNWSNSWLNDRVKWQGIHGILKAHIEIMIL